MRIEQIALIETDRLRNQRPVGLVRRRLDGARHHAEELGQFARTQGKPSDDTQTATTAALDSPEQIRIGTGIGDAHRAIGRNDLRLQQSGRRSAVVFRETAETTTLNKTRNAHRGATATLNVATAPGGHRIIGIDPHRASADRHRRLRRLLARATMPNKGVMQGDVIHSPRPYQQRVGRVGRTLVTVTTAFDDQTQMVLARKIDRGDDIGRVPGSDRICAWLRGPGIDPAAGLGQRRLVADVVRILQILQRVAADRARGRRGTVREWRFRLEQMPTNVPLQAIPGTCGRPSRIAWPHTRVKDVGTAGGGPRCPEAALEDARQKRDRYRGLEQISSIHRSILTRLIP